MFTFTCIVKHREGQGRETRGIREEGELTGVAVRGWARHRREKLPLS
jgi:hypothetical protein